MIVIVILIYNIDIIYIYITDCYSVITSPQNPIIIPMTISNPLADLVPVPVLFDFDIGLVSLEFLQGRLEVLLNGTALNGT